MPNSKRSNYQDIPKGLDGVVVDDTYISDVDGTRGRLIYRTTNVEELVKGPFSHAASLIVTGAKATDISAAIDRGCALTPRARDTILAQPRDLHPMHLLQAMVPLLEATDRFDFIDESHLLPMAHGTKVTPELVADCRTALGVAVRLPEIIATHLRGADATTTGSNFNDRFLNSIAAPDTPLAREAFNVMQILQLEHSFNASAFAARVVASTLAPIANALSAGIGTLHGVLHGGADQAALETADQVGCPSKANDFVDQCLDSGVKVMGMGHREYRVVDPRAIYAKHYAQELTLGTEFEQTYRTLEAIEARFTERMAERGKDLYANIEFYKGLIFRTLGLSPNYFTAMFAMARVFGYSAHVLESRLDNRLIRPAANYLSN